MKFSSILKSVALASALVASSSFAASYSFVDGATSLSLSQDILGVYDLLGVSTASLAGSTSTVTLGAPTTYDANGNVISYQSVTVAQPTTSVTTSGASLLTGAAAGSGITEVRGSNVVTVKNFNLDVANNILYADIISKGVTYTQQQFLIAGADSAIVGSPKTISSTLGADGYYHATGSMTNLVLAGTWNASTKTATGALALLANGLGVTGLSVGTAYNVHIGDLVSDTRFSAPTAAVPEPSTYALMIAGLAGVGFVARRRKAA